MKHFLEITLSQHRIKINPFKSILFLWEVHLISADLVWLSCCCKWIRDGFSPKKWFGVLKGS